MVKEIAPLDISSIPDLPRIAEGVRPSGKQIVLSRASEEHAFSIYPKPLPKRQLKRRKARQDYEAIQAAAGGWEDLDVDRLVAVIYADRRISYRQPV